ncbi:hypothetical protein AX15_006744, partial [Amanita polypyramis BW_CC]
QFHLQYNGMTSFPTVMIERIILIVHNSVWSVLQYLVCLCFPAQILQLFLDRQLSNMQWPVSTLDQGSLLTVSLTECTILAMMVGVILACSVVKHPWSESKHCSVKVAVEDLVSR